MRRHVVKWSVIWMMVEVTRAEEVSIRDVA